uniref:ATP synthase complex subunit 8 n=1 Tax=Scleropages jardinii TaxID=113541 RepID=U5TAB1_9TELE|nr:ATP synthase F0 subunit 8 [Scleropages jardinii]AGY95385.1 ATP synthase F0 subunit 8 [Scleropages jardinii]UNI92166.1 ATP synthase F0 subunit 8 [Scleropages jardinii]UNI92179.1 ATP synthase F0 subunit 8 [Scleropages jardinii]UNI92192.1 ATP synthase F0 subunit 8 [Scleropages jardinii]
MPQLNPAPWLLVMLFSWLVLLTVIPPKITSLYFMNEPLSQAIKKHPLMTWNWPWSQAFSTNFRSPSL